MMAGSPLMILSYVKNELCTESRIAHAGRIGGEGEDSGETSAAHRPKGRDDASNGGTMLKIPPGFPPQGRKSAGWVRK